MQKVILISIIIGLISVNSTLAQMPNGSLHYFKFAVSNKSDIPKLNRIISVNSIIGDTVFAYANAMEFNEFKQLNIPYSLTSATKSGKTVSMASTIEDMVANWDKYPTYDLYEQMMLNWATTYPDICTLEEIGTLQSGRKLLALKISDSPQSDYDEEPELFLTSTMHGDETGGYGVLLRLIDYLLTNYNSIDNISQIINNTEIWINPLANPNGSYLSGNATLNGAIRYNANNVNLNRNFPDPDNGTHPDGNSYQEETQMMMDFAGKHHFSIGMNIHGGAEVVNYPWDTWHRRAADDAWWQYVGGNYRDSAQANGSVGYLNDISNGLTNGYDWYSIAGGRQDYMNYYRYCREFTLEISGTKLYPAASLPTLWNANKGALIGYINEAMYGIHGKVITDKGEPVFAKIELLNHDTENSEVYTDNTTGFFTRYLKQGTYNLLITAQGYPDSIIQAININDGELIYIEQIFKSLDSKICIDTTLIASTFYLPSTDSVTVPIINCSNQYKMVKIQINNNESTAWVSIKTDSVLLTPYQQWDLTIYIENHANNDTTFSSNLIVNADTIYNIPILASFINPNVIQLNKTKINNTLISNSLITDTITINNLGNTARQIIINAEPTATWLKIIEDTITIEPSEIYKYVFEVNSTAISTGFYKTNMQFSGGTINYIPVYLMVDTVPLIEVQNYQKNILVNKNNSFTDTFYIANKSGGILQYSINIVDDSLHSKIELTPASGSIKKAEKQAILINISSNTFNLGNHTTTMVIYSDNNTVTLPLNITIDTLPKLFVSTDTIKINGYGNGICKDSVLIKNIGGSMLLIKAIEVVTDGYSLINLSKNDSQISVNSSAYLHFSINTKKMQIGTYASSIKINDSIINVVFNLSKGSNFSLSQYSITHKINEFSEISDSLILTNTGSKTISYTVKLAKDVAWISLSDFSGNIKPGEKDSIILLFNSNFLTAQTYFNKLIIKTDILTRVPIAIEVVPIVK